MAKKTRAELKAYFETNDVPTQAQFEDLVDSVLNFESDQWLTGGQAISAHAGGGQANATPIVTLGCTINVCANNGDSILLPETTGGTMVAMVNATIKSVNIYPRVGGSIMMLGVNNPYALASGKTCAFMSGGANVWAVILGA
jgi:hypothetical protein